MGAKLSFHGGIHPNDGKEFTKTFPIEELFPKEEMVYPLSQHIGARAIPIVKKGDCVLAGELIAKADGFVSSNIHASISGQVKEISKRRVVGGDLVESIVISNDGLYKSLEFIERFDLEELSSEEVLGFIKEAGIVGMGGAGFPTHVKLSPKNPQKIDRIIANCAECEPYLTSDYRRMMEEPEKLVEGMRIVLRLFPKAKGIFAVEDNKKDCAKNLQKYILKGDAMTIKLLPTKYPQGSERHLIYATTGRAIHSAMLPADANCIVQNVDTIIAIYNAIKYGRPLTRRVITVSGNAFSKGGNYLVPIGTSLKEIVDHVNGFSQEPQKMICGGPMMGTALFDLQVPVVKTSSALLAFTRDEISMHDPTACIRCGKCSGVCPGRILPSKLSEYADHNNEEMFLKLGGMECCECGCCSYVCPAKRHLTQSIKSMRRTILSKRKN